MTAWLEVETVETSIDRPLTLALKNTGMASLDVDVPLRRILRRIPCPLHIDTRQPDQSIFPEAVLREHEDYTLLPLHAGPASSLPFIPHPSHRATQYRQIEPPLGARCPSATSQTTPSSNTLPPSVPKRLMPISLTTSCRKN